MGLPIYCAESLNFETEWSKLEDRRKSRKLNLFDKIENNMAPTYVSRDGSRISSEGGAHLKKLRRAEGGAQIFGVFRVKNHDFTPTNLIFSPGSAPVLHTTRVWIYTSAATLNMKRLQG